MPKNPLKLYHQDFDKIYQMIVATQGSVFRQVNQQLISLYWKIGEYVSHRVTQDGWGMNIVEELSGYVQERHPTVKGFSARNIWRMKQFYETYIDHQKLPALLTEISWSNHLHILSKTKTIEEKAFYLNLAANHNYSERNFARIIDSGTYERTSIADKKLSAPLTEFPIDPKGVFKDSYVFEFLNLSEQHSEHDLRKSLINHLKKFLFELGPDFTLMGEEYPLQVGKKDFKVDLLMFHRGLNCMVAIELKSTEFHPSHLGQLQFYLEVLDRDIKKPHENPTIGILICKTKDEEVVKYATSRHASPTMIAEYETKLIKKSLLEQRLHEISQVLPWDQDEK